MIIMCIMFILIGASCYSVYGGTLVETIMEKFTWNTHKTLYIFNAFYNIFLMCWTPYLLIAFFEPLENFSNYKKVLTRNDGSIKRWLLVLLRTIGCSLIMS